MRKIAILVVVMSIASVVLFGCSSEEKNAESDGRQALEILEGGDQAAAPTQVVQEGKAVRFDTDKDTSDEPLDFTQLDSLMVYGAVYDMLVMPEDYFGRQIKIKGSYYSVYQQDLAEYFSYIIIMDEQACCGIQMEVVWEGSHTYPDDLPEDGTEIEVMGAFGYYEWHGTRVCCILTDSLSRN